MKPLFPYFGGKSPVAKEVWQRFGKVDVYVEPFFGSGAVLFRRPIVRGFEIVNDKDCFISNFWRAVKNDPQGIKELIDYPVNECDLHARHIWLVNTEFRDKLYNDPEFYDVKVAAWWVWGLSQWIGSGWCLGSVYNKMPQLANNTGVVSPKPRLSKNVPNRLDLIDTYAKRLRYVKVCVGDWTRVLNVDRPSAIKAYFLDPPYTTTGRETVYSHESFDVGHECHKWALEHGDDRTYKIALCGYDGEYEFPDNWHTFKWEARGGMANQSKDANSRGRKNAKKETIWFSPHCLNATQLSLF